MKKSLLSILLVIGLLLIGVKSYAGLQEAEQALEGVEGWTEEKLFIDSTLITNKNKVGKLKKLKNLSLKRKGEYEKKANETISDLDKKTYNIIKNVYEYLAFKIEEVLKNSSDGGIIATSGNGGKLTSSYGFRDFNPGQTRIFNGTTGDQLQNEINKGPGIIKLGAKTIKLNKTLFLKSGIKLIGEGYKKTKLLYSGGDEKIIKIKGTRNVTIENLTIDGMNAGGGKKVGIHVTNGAINTLIKGLKITNIGKGDRVSIGIIFGRNNTSYFTFDSNIVINVGLHGLETHGSDAGGSGRTHHGVISNNIFSHNGMGLDVSSYSHDIELFNNDFSYLEWGAKIVNAQNIKFHHNTFHDLSGEYTFDFQQTDSYGFPNKNIEFAFNKATGPITSVDEGGEYGVNSHDNSF